MLAYTNTVISVCKVAQRTQGTIGKSGQHCNVAPAQRCFALSPGFCSSGAAWLTTSMPLADHVYFNTIDTQSAKVDREK